MQNILTKKIHVERIVITSSKTPFTLGIITIMLYHKTHTMLHTLVLLTLLTMSDILSHLTLRKFKNAVNFTSELTPYQMNT